MPTTLITLAIVSVAMASVAAIIFLRNVSVYRPAPEPATHLPAISVLIPARNEESNIAAVLESVLASRGTRLEVLVGDDHSDDRTPEIIKSFAERDPRVGYVSIPQPPAGWNGKQHACSVLAGEAKHDVLCFIDADVRLTRDALARTATFLQQSRAALVSGVPFQQLGSWLEQLLLPLIHFVLLAYLPVDRMRSCTKPAYAAGCGQLFMMKKNAYHAAGGHAAIRETLHDGIRLPRAFRVAGFRTDLFDATDLATCRMYSGARQVWLGLAKNAVEGMAAPARIGIFSFLLLAGQVLPFIVLAIALRLGEYHAARLAALAVMLSLTPRLLGVLRFRQPLWSALAQPFGVIVLLAVQWWALLRHVQGKPASWRGRACPIVASGDPS